MINRYEWTCVLLLGRGIERRPNDLAAGAVRHVQPLFLVAILLRHAGTAVLAGAAVVLAGLGDAGALLETLLGGLGRHAGRTQTDGNEAGDGSHDNLFGILHLEFS